MQFNPNQYDIIEVFEENANQLVLLAVDNEKYDDIVIINKVNKSNIITDAFIKEYKSTASNLIQIDEQEDMVVMVNTYKDSTSLKEYLIEKRLDFNERIRLAKSFLSQISNYENFTPAMQHLLIHEDQLTIKNEILLFSDYLFLDHYDHTITSDHVLSQIGHILELILQLHRETINSEIASLKALITDLLDHNLDIDSFNDIYNEFKILASKIEALGEEIHYSEFASVEKTESKTIDLEYIKAHKIAKENSSDLILEASDQTLNIEDDVFDEALDQVDTIDLEKSDTINLENDTDQPIIDYDFDSDDSTDSTPTILFDHSDEEDIYTDLALSLEDLEINPNFIEDFSGEETEKDNEASIEEEEADITESILDALSVFVDESQASPIEKATEESIDEIEIEEVNDEFDKLLSNDLFESWMNKETETTIELDKIASEIEAQHAVEAIQPVLEDGITEASDETPEAIEPLKDENKLDEEIDVKEESAASNIEEIKPFVKEESISDHLDDLEDIIDTIRPPLDEKTHLNPQTSELVEDVRLDELSTPAIESDITFGKEPINPEAALLSPSNETYNDLYITEKKKETNKTYYVPSFLAFFIILLVITSLLLYYTGTYI